jgi:CRP-like cAMP-binding protein
VFKSLVKGAYFGDIEVIMQIPRKYTVRAGDPLNLLSMNKSLVQ